MTAVVAFCLMRTVGSPDYVKQTFNEIRLYEAVGNQLASGVTASTEDATVQRALASALTEERLKVVVEQSVDQAYAVLNGDIQAKEFSVDITKAKEEFLRHFDNDLTQQLTRLPPCNFANLPTSTDVLSYSCLPTGADINMIVAEAQKEALAQNELLNTGAVNIHNIDTSPTDENAPPTADDLAASFQQAADMYQLSKLLLPVSAGFALLSAVGVIVLSRSRLRGVRRVGALVLGNALVLAVFAFIGRALAQNFPINNAEGTIMPVTAFELAGQRIAIDLLTITLKLSLVLFIFGLALVLLMSALITKNKPKESAPDDTPVPPNEPPIDLEPSAKP